MATYDGGLVDGLITPLSSGTRGRFVVWDGTVATLGASSSTTYYKMTCTDTAASSGWVTWVNTTGDTTGRPASAGTQGPARRVAAWTV